MFGQRDNGTVNRSTFVINQGRLVDSMPCHVQTISLKRLLERGLSLIKKRDRDGSGSGSFSAQFISVASYR